MRQVSKKEYDQFVRDLPEDSVWTPVEGDTLSVMQITNKRGLLEAQASYQGHGKGIPVTVTYEINAPEPNKLYSLSGIAAGKSWADSKVED